MGKPHDRGWSWIMKGVEGHRQDFEVYPEWDGNQRSGLSKGCRNMPFVLW